MKEKQGQNCPKVGDIS